MSESIKTALEKSNDFLVTKLEEVYKVPVFQDRVHEDEMEVLQKKNIEFFIYETGGYIKQNQKSVSQEILLKYLSEKRDDLDLRMLEIASSLDGKALYTFNRSVKTTVKKSDTDYEIDYIEFYFTRIIKYGG